MKNETVVPIDSPEAAKQTTVTGWVSRDGMFYGDREHLARWAGCTHVYCNHCGALTPKGYTACNTCREEKDRERYEALPLAEWDGKAMLYSYAYDQFFDDPGEAEDCAHDHGSTLEDLRLVICEPEYASIDADYFESKLPEGDDVPLELAEAIEAFNKTMAGVVLSWSPGNKRLVLDMEAHAQ